jgi:hypothetical protein
MPAGPGKYDDLATLVRQMALAEGVVVIIVNGNKGHGFSVQASAEITKSLPSLLDMVAREIKESA